MKEKISLFIDSTMGKIIGWATIALLVILPYVNIRGYLYDRISSKAIIFMIVIELIAIAIGAVVAFRNREYKIPVTPLLIAGIVFLVIYLITTLTGVAPAVSFWSKAPRVTGLFFLIHVFFLACLIGTYARDAKWLKRIVGSIFFSGLAFSLLSWLGNDGFKWGLFTYNKGQGFTIGNTTFAGTFLILCFIFGLWYVWGTQWRKDLGWRKLLPFVLMFNPIFLNIDLFNGKIPFVTIFSSPLTLIGPARAAAFTMIAGSILWIGYRLVRRIKAQKVRRGAMTGAVAVLAIVFVGTIVSLANPTGKLRAEFESLSGGGRPIAWAIAGKSIAERPIVGWGGDNYNVAFQQHFDNRLFLPQYGEVWFDRAHNIFVDTLVDGGVLGLLAYLSLYGAAIFVVWRVMKRSDESSKNVAIIVTLGLLMHLLDIQTSFDTVVSLITLGALFGVVGGYVVTRRDWKSVELPSSAVMTTGAVLVILAITGLVFTNKIRAAERANITTRTIGTTEGRLALYPKLLNTPMDMPAFMWRTTTDLEMGITAKGSLLADPKKVAGFVQEFQVLDGYYADYLADHPDNYRMILNYADTKIFVYLFGVDKLGEAKALLDTAEKLVPSNPMPNVMRSVIAVYQNNFKDAYKYIAAAKAMVPGPVPYLEQTEAWIKKQQQTFPDVDFRIIEKI